MDLYGKLKKKYDKTKWKNKEKIDNFLISSFYGLVFYFFYQNTDKGLLLMSLYLLLLIFFRKK